jgi:8-oxo-dGTP pyrophosphatase MutT (NUDIX family)
MMAIVFTGRVFSIDVEKIRLANEREYQVETVRHRPSVVLLPMKDEDHVVLIRQFRHSIGRELWELPAGSLEPGESAESAAARECEEEIALVPGRIERIRDMVPAPGFCDEVLIYFRLSDLRPPDPGSPHAPDEDEEIQAQVFTVADAKAMVDRGEISDLKTAYGLTLI